MSDMTSISRVDSPRLASSSTPARLMRPPVKSVRAAPKGDVDARLGEKAHANDAAPPRHGVKTYLYPYRYTKKASLKPSEPIRTIRGAPAGGPRRLADLRAGQQPGRDRRARL